MAAADAAWLLAQRWFRSKDRPIAAIETVDHAALPPGDLTILAVTYADDGEAEHYLLPLVDGREPQDGDGAWMAIVGAMRAGVEVPGRTGRFVGSHTDALARSQTARLDERRLRVEQSNTSVRIGEGLILKLYRLLEPGPNPDLEMSEFLAAAGFPDAPALAGALTWQPHRAEASTAAMLQAFVPSRGDAWGTMLRVLRTEPAAGLRVARRVGELTRRLHAALVSVPSEEFPARAATVAETTAWRASAERQLAGAVAALTGEDHQRLVELAPAVRARFADTFGAASQAARVSRIHGDLHLGQLLERPDGGFSVIDFEGEPARPLAERRAASSPLRDVAGLLRSLDYAARTAQRDHGGRDIDAWLPEARAALLGGYGGIANGERPLLDAFELEKACYEVRYEAGNRPDWVWLPLTAIERVVAAA